VAHVPAPLLHRVGVQLLELGVVLSRPFGHRDEGRHHPAQVPQGQGAGVDRVLVSHRLGEIPGIIGRVRGGPAEPGHRVLDARQPIEGGPFLIGRARTRDDPVPPLHGVLVIGPDLGHQEVHRNGVLRLRHVVESRVVHQRGDVSSHPPQEGRAPQTVRVVGIARLHVVGKPDRVSHLVGHHILDEPSHQGIGQGEVASSRIERAHLDEVPVPQEVHDVVIHVHFALEDLPGARVHHLPSCGVRDRRGTPVDDRLAQRVVRPVGILRGGGCIPALDRVGEPGLAERHLPGIDPLLDPRLEPFRRGRIDPVDDRLHWIRQRGARVLLLQAESMDVAPFHGAVLPAAVIQRR